MEVLCRRTAVTCPFVDDFVAALSQFATGVTVVSARDRDESGEMDVAVTVSSLMSVSLSPPLVAIGLAAGGYVAEVLTNHDEWGISVLSAQQLQLAGRFAASGRPAPHLLLTDTPHHRGTRTGVLLLDEALTAFECRTVQRIPAADHLLLIGEVLDVPYLAQHRDPLVRFGRAYRRLAPR